MRVRACTCINYTYPIHNLFHYNLFHSLGVEIRVTEFDIYI